VDAGDDAVAQVLDDDVVGTERALHRLRRIVAGLFAGSHVGLAPLADRERRIATLTVGLRTWRERTAVEQAERRREAGEARDREREIISLLHQQMQMADAATAELERIRALPWWRRLRS